MGANNLEMTGIQVRKNQDAVKKLSRVHREAVKESNYWDGHDPYSGGWNTIPAVRIDDHIDPFPSLTEARDYGLDHAEKWDFAVAVRYKDGRKVRWAIFGWAAS